MNKPLLIIISGRPATGKTSIGKNLAKEFCLPIICKDDLKENLYDSMGIGDRDWSRKLGQASMELLYFLAEALLSARKSVILESPFEPKFANPKFTKLKKKYDFNVIQIQCHCQVEERNKRFKERWESGKRHCGHLDNVNLDYMNLISELCQPIKIDGKIFKIDTTDFKKVNYEKIYSEIRKYITND
jgi:predicted kinase